MFINTATPGFFIRYFEYLQELIGEGTEMTPEVNKAALMRFATVPLTDEEVKRFEDFAKKTAAVAVQKEQSEL